MIKLKQAVLIGCRILISGIVASVAWYFGLMLVFGPAQQFLANPDYQSAKFLSVFTHLEPLPRMMIQPIAFYTGFLVVGIMFSLACYLLSRWMSDISQFKKGILIGFIAWLFMNPWFEFYLPWNVMHEPLKLVLLEMTLWLIVLLIVGIITIYAHSFLRSRNL